MKFLKGIIETFAILNNKKFIRYLDLKRNIFSRFYFISDPALLEILGQASNSHSIQPHLLSLFDNTAKLIFSPSEYDKALEIVSREGESIKLEHQVTCVGGVENWLTYLLNETKFTVNQIIANVVTYMMTDPTFTVITMVDQFPSQVPIKNYCNIYILFIIIRLIL
jgi:dynein heavy chain